MLKAVHFFLFFFFFFWLHWVFVAARRLSLLFLAALGLRCCMQALSTCGERELLFMAVHGLLIAVASLVA